MPSSGVTKPVIIKSTAIKIEVTSTGNFSVANKITAPKIINNNMPVEIVK